MRPTKTSRKQPATTKRRAVPRPFEMHWGSGQIVEEASWTGPHHEPAIQLMQYEDGEAAGTASVRFCFYSPVVNSSAALSSSTRRRSMDCATP